MKTFFFLPRAIRLLALGVAVACSGCATTAVNVAGRFPAHDQAAANLRRIAVAGFQGRGGDEFAASLETELANAQFDGKPYFTLVGSGARSGAGVLSPRDYGRTVGATGVYFGQITERVSSEPLQMETTACARWENRICKQWYQAPVTCERRTVAVAVTPRLMNVATGEIVYTDEKTGQEQTTWCPGAPGTSDVAMIADIQRGILRNIHMDVAPNVQVVQAHVMDDTSGLNGAMGASFEEAVKQMKASNTQSACQLWTKIHDEAPSHVPTVFNLGVCAESAGRHKQALDFYTQAGDLKARPSTSAESSKGIGGWLHAATAKAQALVVQPDDNITTAKNRVQRLIAAQGQLTTIDMTRKADAARERREAAAAERSQQEKATRERREAAAAKQRQDEAVAAHKRDIIAKYGESAGDAILQGKVINGMSKDAVITSIGKPQRTQAASASEEMWIYPSEDVIFTNGKVSYVGKQ